MNIISWLGLLMSAAIFVAVGVKLLVIGLSRRERKPPLQRLAPPWRTFFAASGLACMLVAAAVAATLWYDRPWGVSSRPPAPARAEDALRRNTGRARQTQQLGPEHRPFVAGRLVAEFDGEAWLRAGYTGFASSGEKQSNCAGILIDDGFSAGKAGECTTFAPRNSRLEIESRSVAHHRHVVLSPGVYLFYAQLKPEIPSDEGEMRLAPSSFLSGRSVVRWLEVGQETTIRDLNFTLTSKDEGAVEIHAQGAAPKHSLLILPLDDEGELPEGIGDEQAARLAFQLNTPGEVTGERTTIEGLSPGHYRVYYSDEWRMHMPSKDVQVESGERAFVTCPREEGS